LRIRFRNVVFHDSNFYSTRLAAYGHRPTCIIVSLSLGALLSPTDTTSCEVTDSRCR